MKDDSIPICRSILDHWVYKDAEYLKVWLTMLSRARYSQGSKVVTYEKSLCTLNYGQFIFGRKAWSKKTGVSEQRLRGLIKKLITDNMLVVSSQTNHFTIYEIVNYAKFNQQQNQPQQGIENINNQQLTTSQPAVNQQQTTNEECIKKEKKDKKVLKDMYGVTQFKPPTIEEVKAYCLERNNSVDADKWHDFYSSKGWMVGKNKMKDWQAAVRTWEHKDKQGGQAQYGKTKPNEVGKGNSKPWESDPYIQKLERSREQ
jgi:hypothetical protein